MSNEITVKQISVNFKFTKNLGNYESMAAEAGMIIELDPESQDMYECDKAYELACEDVKGQVRKQIESKGGNTNGK